ncbi:hypothetical protein GCM10009535_37620 [Streptomyces thermocarboxydovorans]|uniref:HXXEE domain-containing protein n=1 Tax=Streptomyces thermocarboxydovorans TaxID=59298 RepID=A0ABP3SNE2_9ACTN
METGTERVGGAVTLGLLAAWAVHDAEELATVPGWLRRNVPQLRSRTSPQASRSRGQPRPRRT